MITIEEAFNVLKDAMKKDIDYARGWHANISICCQDAGVDRKAANDGASRFMKLCFDVDIKQN
jgi:hypothetical protein